MRPTVAGRQEEKYRVIVYPLSPTNADRWCGRGGGQYDIPCPSLTAAQKRAIEESNQYLTATVTVQENYLTVEQYLRGQRTLEKECESPAIAGEADVERGSRLDAERCTLQFAQASTRRLDCGKRPFEESPLFGGAAQQDLF